MTTAGPRQSVPPLTPALEASPDSRSDGQLGPGPRSETVQDPVQSDDRQQSRCRYKRRDGSPCQSFATYPDQGCIAHSQAPAALDSRRAGSAKGGHRRSNLARACRIVAAGPFKAIASTLEQAIAETFNGTLDPARAHGIAALARSVVAVQDAALVTDRLDELEAEVARIRSGEIVGETFTRSTP
jgi:hypothetical protein